MKTCNKALAFVLILTGLSVSSGQQLPQETDLCSTRPNVSPNGEHLEKAGDWLWVYVNWTLPEISMVAQRCLMRFSTCLSCRLHVTAEPFSYSPCTFYSNFNQYRDWCVPGCVYVNLYDKDYTNQTYSSNTQYHENKRLDFYSVSSFLYVIACANQSWERSVYMRLKVSSEEKVVKYYKDDTLGSFSSPFFPDFYVQSGEVFKFKFQAATQDEFITITFDDWMLSPLSFITFDSANIRGPISGNTVRPWVLSDRDNLEMIFQTGGNTIKRFRGFKATYKFHQMANRQSLIVENTSCGSFIENTETGVIQFNPSGSGDKYYDCVWVINRHPSFKKIAVKIENFGITGVLPKVSGHNNKLQIIEGPSSLGTMVQSLEQSLNGYDTGKRTFSEYESNDSFYVRLQGYYAGSSDFVLTYTSFNIYENCRNLYSCKNGRCIPQVLRCDGYDNCGDGTDEENCGSSSNTPPVSSPISIGIIIPMVVSVFLIIVICLLIIFIRRCRRMSNRDRHMDRNHRRLHINTVSGEVSRHAPRRRRRRGDPLGPEGEWIPRDPPPSYEDVLNNTPIGCLNLGYANNSRSTCSSHPLQPPSYDEAMSPTPTTMSTAFDPDSSDSSSPLTISDHSHINLSTTYSSDNSQIVSGQRNRSRHCHRDHSSDSSDSSNYEGPSRRLNNGSEGTGEGITNNQGRERGENEGNITQSSEPGQINRPNNIIKPEDSMIEAPALSSEELAQKSANSQTNKSKNATPATQEELAVQTLLLHSCTVADSPAEQNTSPFQSQSVEQQLNGESSSCVDSSHRAQSNLQARTRNSQADAEMETSPNRTRKRDRASPGRQKTARSKSATDRQRQSSPGTHRTNISGSSTDKSCHEQAERDHPSRHVPSRIQKAKNASAAKKHLMKHLSRSVGDLRKDDQQEDRQGEQSLRQLPPRQFSKSVQNLNEESTREGLLVERGSRMARMDRGLYHHQSQQLSSATIRPDQQTLRAHEQPKQDWIELSKAQSRLKPSEERRQLSGYQYDAADLMCALQPFDRNKDTDRQYSRLGGDSAIPKTHIYDTANAVDHYRTEGQGHEQVHRDKRLASNAKTVTGRQEHYEDSHFTHKKDPQISQACIVDKKAADQQRIRHGDPVQPPRSRGNMDINNSSTSHSLATVSGFINDASLANKSQVKEDSHRIIPKQYLQTDDGHHHQKQGQPAHRPWMSHEGPNDGSSQHLPVSYHKPTDKNSRQPLASEKHPQSHGQQSAARSEERLSVNYGQPVNFAKPSFAEMPPGGSSRHPVQTERSQIHAQRPQVHDVRPQVNAQRHDNRTKVYGERPQMHTKTLQMDTDRPQMHAERPQMHTDRRAFSTVESAERPGRPAVPAKPKFGGSKPAVRSEKSSATTERLPVAERAPESSHRPLTRDRAVVHADRAQATYEQSSADRESLAKDNNHLSNNRSDVYTYDKSYQAASNAHSTRVVGSNRSVPVFDSQPVFGQQGREDDQDKRNSATMLSPSSQQPFTYQRTPNYSSSSRPSGRTGSESESNFPHSPTRANHNSIHNAPSHPGNYSHTEVRGAVASNFYPTKEDQRQMFYPRQNSQESDARSGTSIAEDIPTRERSGSAVSGASAWKGSWSHVQDSPKVISLEGQIDEDIFV